MEISKSKNVPEIRFEGFNADWHNYLLGEFGKVRSCKRIYKNETSDYGDIPFYKIGTFGSKADTFIDFKTYNHYKKNFSYPKNGDLLISASGSLGKVVEYMGDQAYYQDSNIVWLDIENDLLKNKFLKHLYSYINWDTVEGSTIKRLYNKDILSKRITIPSREEQMNISKLFELICKKLDLEQQKHKKLLNFKKAMLNDMFPKEGEKIPKVRFEKFDEEWNKSLFSDEVNILRGLTYNPKYISDYGSGIRVLRSSNIKNNTFVLNHDDVFVDRKAINIPYTKNNNILITAANGSTKLIGKHAIVDNLKFNSTVHGGFMLLGETKEAYFINALMGSSWYKNLITLKVSGGNGAIGNLKKSDFDDLPILVPSRKEQTLIGNFFKNLDEKIELTEERIKKIEDFKKSMLEKMFV